MVARFPAPGTRVGRSMQMAGCGGQALVVAGVPQRSLRRRGAGRARPWAGRCLALGGPGGPSPASVAAGAPPRPPPGLCAVAAVFVCVGRRPHYTLLMI